MLDITLLSTDDYERINLIYYNMIDNYNSTQIDELNEIFSSYLTGGGADEKLDYKMAKEIFKRRYTRFDEY